MSKVKQGSCGPSGRGRAGGSSDVGRVGPVARALVGGAGRLAEHSRRAGESEAHARSDVGLTSVLGTPRSLLRPPWRRSEARPRVARDVPRAGDRGEVRGTVRRIRRHRQRAPARSRVVAPSGSSRSAAVVAHRPEGLTRARRDDRRSVDHGPLARRILLPLRPGVERVLTLTDAFGAVIDWIDRSCGFHGRSGPTALDTELVIDTLDQTAGSRRTSPDGRHVTTGIDRPRRSPGPAGCSNRLAWRYVLAAPSGAVVSPGRGRPPRRSPRGRSPGGPGRHRRAASVRARSRSRSSRRGRGTRWRRDG